MSIYAIPSGSISKFVNTGTEKAINIFVITLWRKLYWSVLLSMLKAQSPKVLALRLAKAKLI